MFDNLLMANKTKQIHCNHCSMLNVYKISILPYHIINCCNPQGYENQSVDSLCSLVELFCLCVTLNHNIICTKSTSLMKCLTSRAVFAFSF